jgi:hypothetical protein
MTGFNHGLTGALIAITIKKPELAIPLAFLSHFAQDAIPHHDYFNEGRTRILRGKFNYLLAADFIASVVLMVGLAFLFPAHKYLIWVCMVAAASPDLVWAYYYLYLDRLKSKPIKLDWLSRFHQRMEWFEFGKGAYVELAWIIVIGAIILSLR